MTKLNLSAPNVASDPKHPVAVGLERWRQQYNASLVLDADKLAADVEAAVAALDEAKEAERRRAEAMAEEEEADEDGWTTVSRHTSRKPVGKGSAKAQAKIKAREAKKRKRKELENFYRHQVGCILHMNFTNIN